MTSPARIIVFTDLDGTLLDHDTYDFHPALPALRRLRRHRIPLVVCTSKTAAEICALRTAIDNTDPFISENGGGIFVPSGYFSFPVSADREAGGFSIIEIGTGYAKLSSALARLMRATGRELRGFSMMTQAEVAALCGFSLEQAALAVQRDYDEPFVLKGVAADAAAVESELSAAASSMGLRVTRGGRFFHLTGSSDKGGAVKILKELFRRQYSNIFTIALGDSANDEPMLQQADAAVVIQKKTGSYGAKIPGSFLKSAAPGPNGWNEAVCRLLERLLPEAAYRKPAQ